MQTENSLKKDPALAALVIIARFHSIAADAAQIRHESAIEGMFGAKEVVLAARRIGMKARIVPFRPERVDRTPLPALVLDREGQHFILAKLDGDTALIMEPDSPAPAVKPLSEVVARSTGSLILFTSRASILGDLARFDFSWFIPAIIRYRKLLMEVLAISLVLQLFGLVTPLMFQVVMDKVLVNR
ncbi:MAG: type I secretion system permease/ATPase, partial [Methylobacillus sp.]|nr:type I secretion system permease/ATPase [Methylobacillus sp.]